jgi:hypothetical protein
MLFGPERPARPQNLVSNWSSQRVNFPPPRSSGHYPRTSFRWKKRSTSPHRGLVHGANSSLIGIPERVRHKRRSLHVPAMYLTSAFNANLAVLAFCEINNLRGLNIWRESESHPLRHISSRIGCS